MTASHLRLASTAGMTEVGEAPSAIRVVLADDHPRMRRSLRSLLAAEDDVEVIAEATDLTGLMRGLQVLQPQVLVLELKLPCGPRSDVFRRLRELVPALAIVVLTMEDSPAFARQALGAGATGLVLKDCADRELPEAVRRAARGEQYVSPRVAARLDSLRRSLDQAR
jgi:two-component system, NarL family, response regulator NreC